MGDYFSLITRSLGIIDSPGVVQQLDLIRDPRVVTVFLLTSLHAPKMAFTDPSIWAGQGWCFFTHTSTYFYIYFSVMVDVKYCISFRCKT